MRPGLRKKLFERNFKKVRIGNPRTIRKGDLLSFSEKVICLRRLSESRDTETREKIERAEQHNASVCRRSRAEKIVSLIRGMNGIAHRDRIIFQILPTQETRSISILADDTRHRFCDRSSIESLRSFGLDQTECLGKFRLSEFLTFSEKNPFLKKNRFLGIQERQPFRVLPKRLRESRRYRHPLFRLTDRRV